MSPASSKEERAGPMGAVLRHSPGGGGYLRGWRGWRSGEPALQAGPLALPQILGKVPCWEVEQDTQGLADGGG